MYMHSYGDWLFSVFIKYMYRLHVLCWPFWYYSYRVLCSFWLMCGMCIEYSYMNVLFIYIQNTITLAWLRYLCLVQPRPLWMEFIPLDSLQVQWVQMTLRLVTIVTLRRGWSHRVHSEPASKFVRQWHHGKAHLIDTHYIYTYTVHVRVRVV